MRRIKCKWSFGVGMLCGSFSVLITIILWLGPSISIKKHGEVVFTDYPIGIKTITFENDLVRIWVTDFPYQRDVDFEPNLLAVCKDDDYGTIWGMPNDNHYYFLYTNLSQNLVSEPPINDIHGLHPLTKARKAQQDSSEQPATAPESKLEDNQNPNTESEGRSQ